MCPIRAGRWWPMHLGEEAFAPLYVSLQACSMTYLSPVFTWELGLAKILIIAKSHP